MSEQDLEQLRYPVGRFQAPAEYRLEDLHRDIDRIERMPTRLKEVISRFDEERLNRAYRPGGWTIRQVIHHLADSHLNAWIRIKWALTESEPLIKAYDEKAWALTPDNRLAPHISVSLLEAHHHRWAATLRTLTEQEEGVLDKTFIHPSTGGRITILRMVQLYAWHGEHHIGHCKRV